MNPRGIAEGEGSAEALVCREGLDGYRTPRCSRVSKHGRGGGVPRGAGELMLPPPGRGGVPPGHALLSPQCNQEFFGLGE